VAAEERRPREIPISDALLPWLEGPRTSPYVFPTTRGPRKGSRYACWPALAFDRARDSAGLTGGVHQLRHTFASHFLARCPDLGLLAEVLGHSDMAVTRLYKHLLPDHLERARNAFQVALSPAAAEALALHRWRARRDPSGKPSGASAAITDESAESSTIPAERATGFEPATSSLGSLRSTN